MRSASPSLGSRVLNTTSGTSPVLAAGPGGDWISRTQSRDSIASNTSTGSGALTMPPPPLSRASGQGSNGPGQIPASRLSNRTINASPSPPVPFPTSSTPTFQSNSGSASRAIAEALEPMGNSILKRQGWVLKEDVGSQGQLTLSKKFMLLDYDASILRFGPSPASVQNTTTTESILRLTRDMRCLRPSDNNNDEDDNCLVEVSDIRGLRLRIQLSSSEDQLEWLTAINSLLG